MLVAGIGSCRCSEIRIVLEARAPAQNGCSRASRFACNLLKSFVIVLPPRPIFDPCKLEYTALGVPGTEELPTEESVALELLREDAAARACRRARISDSSSISSGRGGRSIVARRSSVDLERREAEDGRDGSEELFGLEVPLSESLGRAAKAVGVMGI